MSDEDKARQEASIKAVTLAGAVQGAGLVDAVVGDCCVGESRKIVRQLQDQHKEAMEALEGLVPDTK